MLDFQEKDYIGAVKLADPDKCTVGCPLSGGSQLGICR